MLDTLPRPHSELTSRLHSQGGASATGSASGTYEKRCQPRGAFPTLDWAPSRSSLRGRTARGKDAARGSSPSRSGGPKTKRPQTKGTPLDREAARREAGVMTRPQNAPKRTSRTRVFPRACFVRFPLYLLPVAQRGSSNRPRPTTKRPPTADPRPQTRRPDPRPLTPTEDRTDRKIHRPQ